MSSLAEYLEWFFGEVLAEVHEEWKWESFDGIDVEQAAKLSECCLRLCGFAWLISDQTLVPLMGQVRIHPEISQVTATELRVGEPGPGGMVRTKPDRSWRARNALQQLVCEPRSSWSYVVGYGDFESSDCFETED